MPWPAVASHRELPTAVTVVLMASVGALVLQSMVVTCGGPARKMSGPWSPPMLTFTGIALPAFAAFSVGALSAGLDEPGEVVVIRPQRGDPVVGVTVGVHGDSAVGWVIVVAVHAVPATVR